MAVWTATTHKGETMTAPPSYVLWFYPKVAAELAQCERALTHHVLMTRLLTRMNECIIYLQTPFFTKYLQLSAAITFFSNTLSSF
jgi:hypothetical protein